MKKKWTRLLALFLSVMMVMSCLPMTALAAGDGENTPARYAYVLDTDGVDSGATYAIYTNVTSNAYNRILYHTGNSNTDRVQSENPNNELENNILPLTSKFDASRQTWVIAAVEGGYTVQSVDSGYYLDLSNTRSSAVNTSADPVTLTITDAGDGTVTISKGANNLCFPTASDQNFYAGTDDAASLRLFKKTPVWAVTFTGEGVTESTAEALDGRNAALPEEPTREGYTFQGWFVGEEEFTAATAVTANVTVTARWEKVTVDPDPDPDPETSAYTPADAEAAGYDVHYLSFTTGWTIKDTAYGIKLYQTADDVASATNSSAIALDTDGVDAGSGYVIVAQADNKAMHYSGTYTNQCSFSNTATVGDAANHLFLFEKNENGSYAIRYARTEGKYVTSEKIIAKNSNNNNDMDELAIGETAEQFYVTPANDPNNGTYWIWYQTKTQTNPDPGPSTNPGGDDTSAYTLADAEAAGKVVRYLAFTGGDGGSRWWDVSDTAGATAKIQLYNAAGTTTDSTITLDMDGITAGNYVINFNTGNSSRQAVMHYSNGATDQCSGSLSTVSDTLHLFILEGVEDSAANNAFTIKAYNTAKYLSLDASGKNRAFKDDKTIFYVTPANGTNDGTYYIWTATDPQSLTMAQTEFTGKSNRPMDPEDPGSYFRIPSLVTLSNGWMMATSDIRWYSTNDSPNNLDTIVSISKDGGSTWEYEVVNYFADYAPTKQLVQPYGPAKSASASFIDPAVVQDSEGTIWLLVDAQPPYVNGGKIGNGFDSQGRLLVGHIPGSYSMNNNHDSDLNGYTYNYYVDINNTGAGQSCVVNGESITLWPICAQSDDAQTGYYADAFFNTYYDYGEDGIKPVIAQQHDSTAYIHNNLFYTQSDWKVFPTAFIMLRSATVNEATGKLDWNAPTLLNGQIKHDNEHFIGVCPGRGITTTVNGKERIIFALYDNQTGNELASTIYSDDHGATWTRGEHTPNLNGTGKTSESQIVILPDGNGGTFLRMYSRNGRPTISYVDSHDGGQTWGTSRMDTALNANNQNDQGCMVSFINVAGYLAGPDGQVYENLVLASYPQGTHVSSSAKRTNGTIRIGSYDPEDGNGPVTWLNEETVRYSGSYIYSCLTQKLDEGKQPTANFGLLYETDDSPTVNAANKHFTDILYTDFTMGDLLGEGWTWSLTAPEHSASSLCALSSSLYEIRNTTEIQVPYTEKNPMTVAEFVAGLTVSKGASVKVYKDGIEVTDKIEAGMTVRIVAENGNVNPTVYTIAQKNTYNSYVDWVGNQQQGNVWFYQHHDGGKLVDHTTWDARWSCWGVGSPSFKSVERNQACGSVKGEEGSGFTFRAPASGTVTVRLYNYKTVNSPVADQVQRRENSASSFDHYIRVYRNGIEETAKAIQLPNTTAAVPVDAMTFTVEQGDTLSFLAINGGSFTSYSGNHGVYFTPVVTYECIHAHVETIPGKAATCTTTGLTDGKRCADCDEVLEAQTEIAALGHDFTGEYVSDESGHWHVCAREGCGEREEKTAHTPGEATQENVKNATCTAEGSYDEVVKCTVCGEEISRENKSIAKLPHTHSAVIRENEVPATCTAEGSYDEVVKCTVCGEEISREGKSIAKLPHTPGEAVRENEAAATCTAEGSYDEVVYCSECGEELSRETVIVAKLPHAPGEAVRENEVEATYDAEGSYDEVVYCSACGEELSREGKTVPALTRPETPEDPVVPVAPTRPSTPAGPDEPEPPVEIVDDDPPLSELPLPFVDVAEDAWYREAVAYMFNEGMMNGVDEDRFAPQGDTTRGMIVTILYRMEKEPIASVNSFLDRVDGRWYTKAIDWAAEVGVVNGYGSGNFGADDKVTREQLVAILYRYAGMKGYDVSARADLSGYEDAARVSGYAAEAMSWAVAEGLVQGTSETTLSPRNTATRAQIALILMRFFKDAQYV